MAFTVTPPNAFSTLNDPIVYYINQTGTNTATHRRRFGYQLLKGDDTPLTQEESTTGPEGVDFPLDFTEVLKEYLNPTLPNLTAAQTSSSEMLITFKLKVWELVYEKATGETVVENEATGTDRELLNSTRQEYYNSSNDEYLPNHFLVFQPTTFSMCRKSKDFLGVNPDGASVDVIYTYYNSSGVLIGDTTENVTGPANVLLDPSSFPSNTARITVTIGSNVAHTIKIKPCSCEEDLLIYQSYGGLFGGMMLEPLREGLQITQTDYLNSVPRVLADTNNSVNVRQNRGKIILGKSSIPSTSYQAVIKTPNEGEIRKLRDFLSSEKHYVNKSSGSSNDWKSVVMAAGTIVYYEKEKVVKLIVTFEDANKHYLPA